MSDFIFEDISFGSISFENEDGSTGYMIAFNSVEEWEPTVEDLWKNLQEGTEVYSGWTILHVNEVVERVKEFSTTAALVLMKSEFSSISEVDEALNSLRSEFERELLSQITMAFQSHISKFPLKWALTAILLLLFYKSRAQVGTVQGHVVDTLGNALQKATVKVVFLDEGTTTRTITDRNGFFFVNTKNSDHFKILFSVLGYATDTLSSKSAKDLGNLTVVLKETAIELNEVMVISHPDHPILVSKDTISYDLKSFADPSDRYIYETLARIKGLRVNENGDIFAHGEKISRVMVNDREIFNGNVGLITRNLPTDILETAEIIDDYGKESALTGLKASSTKVLNLHTKDPDQAGLFAELNAGKGTNKTNMGMASLNYFDDSNQLSISGGTNNTNQGNTNDNSVIDNSASLQPFREGLNRTTNVSLNGRTTFKDTGTLYVFADRSYSDNETWGQGTNTSVYEGNNLDYTESFRNRTKNRAGKIGARYDRSFRNGAINFSPWLAVNRAERNDNRNALFRNAPTEADSGKYSLFNTLKDRSYGLDLFLNLKLGRPGRSLNFKLTGSNNNVGDNKDIFNGFGSKDDKKLNILVSDRRDKQLLSPVLSYIEPIGKNALLELSFEKNILKEDLIRLAMDNDHNIKIDSLSLSFNTRTDKDQLSARLQVISSKWSYNFILSYRSEQIIAYRSDLPERNRIGFNRILPALQVAYRFDEQQELSFSAKQYYTLPEITQLLPVPTLTDPLYIYRGNGNLDPENHRIASLTYKNLDARSGSIFRAAAEYRLTDDKITANSVPVGTENRQQVISPENIDGFRQMGIDYYYSRPLGERVVIDLSGRFSTDNNLQYINGELTSGKNNAIHQAINAEYRFSRAINFAPGIAYRYTNVRYGIGAEIPGAISTYDIHSTVRYIRGDFSANVSANRLINAGFTGNSPNTFLINSDISYKLLSRSLVLKLSAFDLLDNNTGIRRTVSNNTVSDLFTNRLSRYFMFAASYKIGKFKKD